MIHSTAIIDPAAELDEGVEISPYAVIGPDVKIGRGSWIGPHTVINGPTILGKNNKVFQFASVGEVTQDKKYNNEYTVLEVGDNNIFRECTTISRGTAQGGGITKIGNGNLFMAYVHIAHDCQVGNNTTFSNNASLAGHVIVEDYANLGGFVGVHQFGLIGAHSFCAGGSIINKDVPPFCMVAGHPAQLHGLNQVGLKRRGFTEEAMGIMKQAYKILFRQGHTIEEALNLLKPLVAGCPEVQLFIDFCQKSNRGAIR